MTRTAGILLIALLISLVCNLGQWERARRAKATRAQHQYELHGDKVFDCVTGDIFTVGKSGEVVRVNLPRFEIETFRKRDVFDAVDEDDPTRP